MVATKKAKSETPQVGFATVREITEHLKISKFTVYRLINSNKLPATIIGKSRRVKWSDIHALHRGR